MENLSRIANARIKRRGLKKFLLTMKVTVLLVVIACLQANAGSMAQRITLLGKNIPVQKVFNEIRKQTGYELFYRTDVIKQMPLINIQVKNATIDETLQQSLKDLPLAYKIVEKIIVIKSAAPQSLSNSHPILPPTEIEGIVTNELGNPVANASIVVKNTNYGVTSDANGKFHLTSSRQEITLVISSVGYQTLELKVKSSEQNVVIKLKTAEIALKDVVVVGYGTQKKVNLSGSVNVVNTKQITDRPVSSLTNSLQGLIPGMTIIGRPGDVAGDIGTINVRGRGNLGSSSPLFVVDGVPVGSDVFGRLNPSDVASISVLKDASASSIYGSRAAYGVILVTTKKGRRGKAQVQLNSNYGWQSATVLPAILDANGYAMLRNEAETNAGRSAIFSPTKLDTIRRQLDPDHFPNTNWIKEALLESAPMWENQLAISGGNDKTRYYVSGSYMRQESLKEGKHIDRYNFVTNMDSKISNIFKIGTNISYIRDQYKATTGDYSLISLMRMIPLTVKKHSDGTWGSMSAGVPSSTQGKDNPVRFSELGGWRNYYQNRFLGTVTGTLTPTAGLNIDGTVSYNLYNYSNSSFSSTMPALINFDTKEPIPNSATAPNQLEETWQNTGNLLTQLTASYEKHYKDHYAKILLGTSYENYNQDNISVTRKNFANNSMGAINGGSSSPTDNSNSGTKYSKTFQSFFGRLNYNFLDRYMFEANLRVDASSQFARGHRTGYFPSFSAAWRISEESFMKNVNWVQQLKLRGSWGILGNVNNVGYYDFYDGLISGSTTIFDQQQVSGVWPGKVYNATLSWEEKQMTNIGIDAILFENKLSFQLDAYHSVTSKILLPDPNVPDEAGLVYDGDATKNQYPSRNLGEVQNDGIELALAYNGMIGNDFSYSVGGNMSKVWNKVLKLDGVSNYYTTGEFYVIKEGAAIGSYYMWQADGLFQSNDDVSKHAQQGSGTQAGDIKYVDQNGDNKINGDDRAIVGNDVPYFTYGLNLNASYKNFDLSIIGQGVEGVSVYMNDEASQPFFNGAGVREFHMNRWTKDNPDPNADFPRMLVSSDNGNNLKQSSFWLFNADYFRIKSLSLGYNFPEKLLRHVGMQKVRFYLAANNFFTIRGDKRLKDFDPETPSSRASYPQLKTLSVGMNLTF